MCGIAGFTWKDASLVRKMTNKIAHRGPDDSGFYINENISLGHRRLSIIDLSKKGHQPMFNEDKKIAVVYVGEIWNYKELKDSLNKKGHKFRSNSDTEVIVHGYEEHGEKIFSLLDGMFSIALWDSNKNKLFLARDKIGKKPLYYLIKNNNLIFSSEIKSILEHKITREINYSCLSEYLSLRFSPDSITMFKGVYKIPPGSFGVFEKGKLKLNSYYSLPSFNYKNKAEIQKADKLISEAIRKRMLSDVPIGVFLSGGLDSSSLVAYISDFTKNLKTFSVSFNSKVDESKYARIIADKFKTKHKEIKLKEDILSYLPEVIYHLDEPLADPAALPTYLLCKEVAKHVKVAISGEGGDEVFGGYDSYNNIQELKYIYRYPYILRFLLSRFFLTGARLSSYPKKHLYFAISKIMSKRNIRDAFKELFYFPFSSEEKNLLFKKTTNEDTFNDLFKESNDLKVVAQNYYFKEWLPNDLLMKADKMGMASSLEIRTPFLDNDLLNYFAGLPYKDKHKRRLFRKVVSTRLPPKILSKKKQGFTLPLYEWFKDRNIQQRVYPFLDRLKKRGIFNPEVIDNILITDSFKKEHKIWVLLCFEIWCEIYLDKINHKSIKI